MSKDDQKPPSKADAVNAMMQQVGLRKTKFHELLPEDRGGNRADWFLAEARVALARAPKLALCTQNSVIDALTTCAQLGLSPSGRLGSAYLIPYGDKCTLVIGYRGYVDLAFRSGEVTSFHAEVVRDNDRFEHEEGLTPVLRHVPNEANPGDLRAVYAVAIIRGVASFVVMYRRQVLPIKQGALSKKGKNSPPTPWETSEEEMWKKTAIRRLIKLLPLSPVNAKALYAAEAAEREYEDAIDADFEGQAASPRGVEGAKEAVRARLSAGSTREELEFSTPEKVPASSEPDAAERAAILAQEMAMEPGANG